MCGTDMDKTNKELIGKLKNLDLLHNAILLGEQKNMPAIYNSIDLLICPSLTESFGLVALEAVACGTNVVCSDIPAFRKFINKNNLIKSNNHKLFAERIKYILKNKQEIDYDKNQLRKEIFKNYNIKNTFRDYYKIYQ